jgi:hypothetical protein
MESENHLFSFLDCQQQIPTNIECDIFFITDITQTRIYTFIDPSET